MGRFSVTEQFVVMTVVRKVVLISVEVPEDFLIEGFGFGMSPEGTGEEGRGAARGHGAEREREGRGETG